LSTRGAVHLVTSERLAAARTAFSDTIAESSRPLIGVLLGGASNSHRGDPETFAKIGKTLADMLRQSGGSAWITSSRRTPNAALNALKESLAGSRYRLWDGSKSEGQGDNPYFAILSAADYIVVTSDSVSMVTEACATGRPVYVADLPGGTKRFRRFHQDMRDEGATRPFSGHLDAPWAYDPVNDTPEVAAEVRRLLERRDGSSELI
jgi:mitochondrial fission protein ELM1